MQSITGGIFEEFEAILKKMLEHFQDLEHHENVELMFNKINFFHDEKNKIEDYEESINSHTRPLRIGFVGGFSTGKSSMINSLLGENILGVKLEPATSQITQISYGEKFEVLEVTLDEDYDFNYKEISLKDYQESSTNRVNKSKNLSHYVIKYPSKNLSRFTIVDTPGFSSTSKEDDELTKSWIDELDLLIWIFDANKVGDKTEYNKIKELGITTKVIGVINKIDTKSPGVREKIKNEISNEELLEDVFLYSSKKVLDEFTKRTSFNENLKSISSEIENYVKNSEAFQISNSDSGIELKTSTTIKTFDLSPLKETSYSDYYKSLVNKIDNVRNNEINFILNQTLISKYNSFRNLIEDELLHYQDVLATDVKDYKNLIKENCDLIEESKLIYENLTKDFGNKINASFKVFYTSFFDELGRFLFVKYVESGIFSNDVYIHMKNLQDEEFVDSLRAFISQKFHSYLEESFDIYEKVIKNSVLKEYSKIEEIREDEYHLIRILVDGLVRSSVEAIIGYYNNFEPSKIESYTEALDFHKSNIDLVVPDEVLENSISNLLIYDLIDAKNMHYLPALESQVEIAESSKSSTSEILNMIDNLKLKLN